MLWPRFHSIEEPIYNFLRLICDLKLKGDPIFLLPFTLLKNFNFIKFSNLKDPLEIICKNMINFFTKTQSPEIFSC